MAVVLSVAVQTTQSANASAIALERIFGTLSEKRVRSMSAEECTNGSSL